MRIELYNNNSTDNNNNKLTDKEIDEIELKFYGHEGYITYIAYCEMQNVL